MGKERVISQVGDSTDGENYEDNGSDINTLFRQYQDYHVSYILKDIGNKLLQSTEVRQKYKKIKKTFIKKLTSQEKHKLESLDKELGYGWGIIVNKYDKNKQKVLADGASSYFEINKEKIEKICGKEPDYKNLNNAADKANYYLEKKVNIQGKFEDIYKLNKKIEIYAQSQRVATEPLFSASHQKDASIFLAKIKASKKLDKDLGKNFLYDYKFGTGNIIGKYSVTKKTTQQNEILEIGTAGGFKHYITDEGTYTDIGKRLKEFIDKDFINANELKKFLQLSLKEGGHSNVILKPDLHIVLIDRLQTLVKLVFGVEVKRNPAALLTNAMFFDLVDAGEYEIAQIAEKMPMAMESAVSASVTIDRKVKEMPVSLLQQKLTSEYDYRGRVEAPKAKKLLERDEEILQEWLKLKLNISRKVESSDTNNQILNLGTNDLVKKLADMKLDHIDTSRCNTRKKIQDEENIGFDFNDCKGTFRLEWDTTSGKYEVKAHQIQEVQAKIFYDLIQEWYGIELPHLNKTDLITLKAAAEPEDPKEDHDYQDTFKVLAIDERKEESKTELSEYKQKYVTNHSKAKSVQKKIDETITDEILKEIHKKACQPSKDLVEALGSKFIISGNKSFEEIISTLEAIYKTLNDEEKFIRSNRLNLKDPNKHHAEGNVLSMDDLFNKVLDSVSETAQESRREDILTTLKEYYYDHQEPTNVLGESGIV